MKVVTKLKREQNNFKNLNVHKYNETKWSYEGT
jgi:hypothetical protein